MYYNNTSSFTGKGLQGVNSQYFVGEFYICSTASNADTKYQKKSLLKIHFQNVLNFRNFGPPGRQKIEKSKYSWSYLESAHQKTYQHKRPKNANKMSQKG